MALNIARSVVLFSIFWAFGIFSTTYLPIPIERQILESDAVIEGKFVGELYKRLPSGDVVTQASFASIKSSGLLSSEVVNPSDFKVLYPGGKWNGIVYHVYGAPKFEIGKEYVLLIKKNDYGYFPSNLSLGQYDIESKNGEKYISSSVFKNHPTLGKINYSKFNELLRKNFGHDLSYERAEQSVYIEETEGPIENELTRIPASNDNEKIGDVNTDRSVIIWHAITLTVMGVIVSLYRKYDSKK